MKIKILASLLLPLLLPLGGRAEVPVMDVSLKTEVRPSATPLITVDPYFSIWSFSDCLNESPTVHWTGRESPLLSYVRVDGKTYRILGVEEPRYQVILNNIKEGPWKALAVFDKTPQGDWTSALYNDSSWNEVEGAIGSRDRQSAKTRWGGNDRDVWVRRDFTLEEGLENAKGLILDYSHDDVFELYINGIKVVDTGLSWKDDLTLELPEKVTATLHKGKNVIAAHCHNTTGGAYVDFGLKRRLPQQFKTQAAIQTGLSVLPTRSVYSFRCGPVDADLIFAAPLLMDDLDLLSRPVNYISWQLRSNDGKQHDVQVYLAASPKQAVHSTAQAIVAETGATDGISFVKAGTKEQNILGRKGDNVRIDWGYVYVATPTGKGKIALAGYYRSLSRFVGEGIIAPGKPRHERDNASEQLLALSYGYDFGKVGSDTVADYVMLAYDDIYSIQYFEQNLRPWWNRNGDNTITGQLALAAQEYSSLAKKCETFDKDLMDKALASGGKTYAELCGLAYRQSIAAHKAVQSPDGELLFFSKENFSNGSIGTVDITYPSSPLYLYYNPDLVKGMMTPIFYFSESGRWTKPFAAHDVGTYPKANGQTYGGDMPVEESGNMLICCYAIALAEGNASYALKHWETLSSWAAYLAEFGLDPAEQLCTDDFAGHFAHNTNLSIKAIMGLASYSALAKMLGKDKEAAEYWTKAASMAKEWQKMANDGDHYRLTFDKSGTWSQKYNLVWDKLLGFNLFDPSIAKTEIKWYLGQQNRYGLPLDSRKTYTKSDWILWTATMAENPADFQALVEPVLLFQNETEDRIPMSDWYFTDQPKHVGFQARSVVGGYFIKLLADKLAEK